MSLDLQIICRGANDATFPTYFAQKVRQLNNEAAVLMETHPTHAQDIEAKRDEISEAWVGLKDQVRLDFCRKYTWLANASTRKYCGI